MKSTLQPLSRRRVLAGGVGLGGAMLLSLKSGRSAEADHRAAEIMSSMITVDMHSHVQIPLLTDPTNPKRDPRIDLIGELRRGGFSAICQTFNLDAVESHLAGDYYRLFSGALDFEDRLFIRNKVKRALSGDDLKIAHAHGEPVVVQSVEGAQFIEGHLTRLEGAYRRGLRHLQLVHERDDLVSPLGDVYTAVAHLGGLTPFGAQVIRECNRLGILVDLAHGTYEMVRAALKVANQPLIISHAGTENDARGKNLSTDLRKRLISEDHARVVADAGGVVGVWWRLFGSLEAYVAAIRNKIEAWGVDHVGIGTDTDLTASYVLPYTNKIWPDQNAGFFYAVVGEMLRQGFKSDEIAKIVGGNFYRVFARATANRA